MVIEDKKARARQVTVDSLKRGDFVEMSTRPTRILPERKLELALSGKDRDYNFPVLTADQLENRIAAAYHNIQVGCSIIRDQQNYADQIDSRIYEAAIAGWTGEVDCLLEDMRAYRDGLDAEMEDYTFLGE